ncbi:hypothetical protein BDZ91DRAFT_731809, partial [Kalaharituber pfeilii]
MHVKSGLWREPGLFMGLSMRVVCGWMPPSERGGGVSEQYGHQDMRSSAFIKLIRDECGSGKKERLGHLLPFICSATTILYLRHTR